MNIQQLKYVVEISRTGSITQAARNLYMGQPNLSKSIKELEEEIGITLFARTPKGVVATPGGEEFISYARSIVAQMESLSKRYQKDAQQGVMLRVSVPRASYVAHSFGAYVGAYTGQPMDVVYRETNALNIINDVAQNRTDVGVVRFQTDHTAYFNNLFQKSGLVSTPIWDYDMVLLMHKNHPLAKVNDIPYSILAKYPEIVHGDFTPVMPPEDDDTAHEIFATRRISVFDRGSQFDMLQSIKGSYLWVSPMPFSVLSAHELVQKTCASATHYCDMFVHRASHPLNSIEQGLMDVLKKDARQLILTNK